MNKILLGSTVLALLFHLGQPGSCLAAESRAGSLEKLDSAANFLVGAADRDQPGSFCGISAEEARTLLRAIHPRIDKGMRPYTRKRSGSYGNPAWAKDCSASCHCGLYASILDQVGDARLSVADRNLRDRLFQQSKDANESGNEACFKKTRAWFCRSDLLKELKKSAKDY